MKAQLILASASPRRKALLDQIGVQCQVSAVDIDETPRPNEEPVDYVIRIAAEKSAACLLVRATRLPILSADTSVVINGNILGKPQNYHDAVSMLTQLSGNTHQVYTAVSLRLTNEKAEPQHFQRLNKTDVKFRQLSEQEIEAYWHTTEPQGKAGAYAIQGLASVFVKSITGSFSGVVGLPLFETAELLSQQGIKIIT